MIFQYTICFGCGFGIYFSGRLKQVYIEIQQHNVLTCNLTFYFINFPWLLKLKQFFSAVHSSDGISDPTTWFNQPSSARSANHSLCPAPLNHAWEAYFILQTGFAFFSHSSQVDSSAIDFNVILRRIGWIFCLFIHIGA